MASRDWIKKEYIMKEVPCPLVLNTAKSVYAYESTDVFQDESLYMVPIQPQESINNQCRHLCPSLPLFFAAALWYHHCELTRNLYPKRYHYDTVACSGTKTRGKLESCVGCWVCFGTRGVVLCNSREVEIRMLSVCIIREEMRMEV
jgi:hypothetical protein